MSKAWQNSERGHPIALAAIVWIAVNLGRRSARIVLWPIVAYYYMFAPASRRALVNYRQHLQGRNPRRRDVFKNFYSFAATFLDRIYFFLGQGERFQLDRHGCESLWGYRERKEGCLLLTSHIGSFEALRVIGQQRGHLNLRILMDRRAGNMAYQFLERFDPSQADKVLDTSSQSSTLALRVKEALEAGEMVGIMADRHRRFAGAQTVTCDFLGEKAEFPLSPWVFAAITGAPIMVCFGLYLGGNRYAIHIEDFGRIPKVKRGQRREVLAEYAQRYADRLAYHLHNAPDNWFIFYDFWARNNDQNGSKMNDDSKEANA